MTELNLIGTTLGRFEILKELGRGGMAVVYQARQTDLDRIIALKVLPPALTHDASYVARFRQEAKSAAHLEHPHIMPIYEVGEAGGFHYIAMKFIAGKTLKDVVQAEGSLSVQRAATYLAQVGDALDYAHKQKVIHRDIKPSNMMVTDEDWVFLTDFGLARGTDGSSGGLTMAGTVMGTPEYMSPEQAQGLPNVGPPTDIYALGVVLYELLTGTFPFKADTPMGMLAARLLQTPIPPRDVRGDLPSSVEDVVMRALARKPESRFPTAAAMVTALRAAAGIGTVEPNRPTTPFTGVPALGATIAGPPPPSGVRGPTPSGNAPYVRPPNPPSVNAPTSGGASFPNVPGSPSGALTGGPTTPPRPGAGNMAGIFIAVGVVLVGLLGLFIGFNFIGKPVPTTVPPTVGVSPQLQTLLDQAEQALKTDNGLATALSTYRSALALAPGDPLVLTKLALTTNASGDWPVAEDYANQLLSVTTPTPRQLALGHTLLADAVASQGDLTSAVDELAKALAADNTLALAHAIQSNLLSIRANAIGSTAEMDSALASVDRAVDSLSDEEPLVQALTRNAIGVTFAQEYDLKSDAESLRQSNEYYQQALALVPSAGLFQANLADNQSKQKNYTQAREMFTKALALGYKAGHAAIGWTYYYEGKTTEAGQAFEQAVTSDPDAPDGYFGKARLRYDTQDYDGAIELFGQAIEHNARSPYYHGWLGQTYFWKGINGSGTAKKDAFAQAVSAYNAALALNDRYTFALSGLAWTLQFQENYADSVAKFEEVIALDPHNAANYDGKGWSLFNQGKYPEAEAAFRAAIERDNTEATYHFHLGYALENQGRKPEARTEYLSALKLDANYSEAQTALDRIGP